MVRKLKDKKNTGIAQQYFNKKRAEVKKNECLWNEEDCDKIIVNAHSIQNNRFLSRICDEKNRVTTFGFAFDESKTMFTEFKEMNRKGFSTFTGFCKKHDKELFQPIEDFDYLGTEEQKFIFCLKAFTREAHLIKEMPTFEEELHNINPLEKDYLEMFSKSYEEIEVFFKILNTHKRIQKNNETDKRVFQDILKKFKFMIEKKEFNFIFTKEIIFENEYPIVACSMFFPYKNYKDESIFDENYIKEINNGNKNPCLFLNIFPQDGKTYILLSCFSEFKDDLNIFFNNLENDIYEQVSFLLIAYCENFAINPNYINKFSIAEKEKITEEYLKNILNPLNKVDLKKINIFKK